MKDVDRRTVQPHYVLSKGKFKSGPVL